MHVSGDTCASMNHNYWWHHLSASCLCYSDRFTYCKYSFTNISL